MVSMTTNMKMYSKQAGSVRYHFHSVICRGVGDREAFMSHEWLSINRDCKDIT